MLIKILSEQSIIGSQSSLLTSYNTGNARNKVWSFSTFPLFS